MTKIFREIDFTKKYNIKNIEQKKDADKEGKGEPSWNASASHVSHQVGVPEAADDQEAADVTAAVEPNKAANKVSFEGQPEVKKATNERVSLDQPPDLFVTSATPVEPPASEDKEAAKVEPKPAQQVEVAAVAAAAEPKVDASNTGTAKRKSKKKRDEVGQSALHLSFYILILIFVQAWHTYVYTLQK